MIYLYICGSENLHALCEFIYEFIHPLFGSQYGGFIHMTYDIWLNFRDVNPIDFRDETMTKALSRHSTITVQALFRMR